MRLELFRKSPYFIKRNFKFLSPSDTKKEYYARKLVGYSIDQMYTVVGDVKNYSNFVPFCMRSTILDETKDWCKANLIIGFPPIVENYTSNVTYSKPNSIRAICKDGRLFHYLETNWHFSRGLKSNPQSCIVDFYVRFEFRSIVHSQIATMFFEKLVQQMENAFITEAKRRYGKESLPTHPLSTVENYEE